MKSLQPTVIRRSKKHLYVLPEATEIEVDQISFFLPKSVYVRAYSQWQAIELILRRLADEKGVPLRCIDFDGSLVEQTITINHLDIFDWVMENL